MCVCVRLLANVSIIIRFDNFQDIHALSWLQHLTHDRKKRSHPTKLYQEATFFTLCAPELVFPMRMSPCNASSLNRSVCGLLRTAIAWLPSEHTHICLRSTCSSNLSNSYFSALRKLIDAEYERESTAQKQRDQKQKVFEQKPFHGALAVKRNRLLPHSDSVVYNNT